MIIFGIESSCDETAASIVENGIKEICSVVSSSKDFHEKTGGIVPEVAARKQVEYIVPVIDTCLSDYMDIYSLSREDAIRNIDAIAVTIGPGLVGSLIVGIEAAKSLSLAWNKPLIPVNHLLGHIYANFLDRSISEIKFPSLALLVSGGHTDLIVVKDHNNFDYLGGTLDDAAGECFDKTARILGISKYLGGSVLSDKASLCKENTLKSILPRPMLNQDNYDFSFSGLKTAVRRLIEDPKYKDYPLEVVCREFEDSIVDVLVTKTIKAAKELNVNSILMGGGVSANKVLRNRLEKEALSLGIPLYIPRLNLCTDNAVYIASRAYFDYTSGGNKNYFDYKNIYPRPSLGIMEKV